MTWSRSETRPIFVKKRRERNWEANYITKVTVSRVLVTSPPPCEPSPGLLIIMVSHNHNATPLFGENVMVIPSVLRAHRVCKRLIQLRVAASLPCAEYVAIVKFLSSIITNQSVCLLGKGSEHICQLLPDVTGDS